MNILIFVICKLELLNTRYLLSHWKVISRFKCRGGFSLCKLQFGPRLPLKSQWFHKITLLNTRVKLSPFSRWMWKQPPSVKLGTYTKLHREAQTSKRGETSRFKKVQVSWIRLVFYSFIRQKNSTAKESLEGPLRTFEIKPHEVGMNGEQLLPVHNIQPSGIRGN